MARVPSPELSRNDDVEHLEARILTIRGRKVLLDTDLAAIYGVPTKRLNEQVKRNRARFPADFAFRLTAGERSEVVANCDHLRKLKYSKGLPWAYTEHGAIMAASVVNSPAAVRMSVFVVRAFVRMRDRLLLDADLLRRLAEIDRTLLEHDEALRLVYDKLLPLLDPAPESMQRRIGFHPE